MISEAIVQAMRHVTALGDGTVRGGADLMTWANERASERCYRVATYSVRDDAETPDVLAADLATVVDAVAPSERQAIIVGESFGGAVALTTALRHPDPGPMARYVIVASTHVARVSKSVSGVGFSATDYRALVDQPPQRARSADLQFAIDLLARHKA